MSKTFLLVYDGIVPPRAQLILWLDEQERVLNWHASPIPNMLAVVWDGSVVELRDLLHAKTGMASFLVIEAGIEKFNKELSGWLAKATVDFLMSSSAGTDRIAS